MYIYLRAYIYYSGVGLSPYLYMTVCRYSGRDVLLLVVDDFVVDKIAVVDKNC